MRKPKTPSNPKKPLRNARREKFAQAVARGLPATQAYMEAERAPLGCGKTLRFAARVDELRRDLGERVVEKNRASGGDKTVRLTSCQHTFIAGQVWAPIPKAWAEDFVDEVRAFRAGCMTSAWT